MERKFIEIHPTPDGVLSLEAIKSVIRERNMRDGDLETVVYEVAEPSDSANFQGN